MKNQTIEQAVEEKFRERGNTARRWGFEDLAQIAEEHYKELSR